ncbi:MAG: hypothetical protein EBS29_13680, partial [Chloroflexia bacterium]|nr:hypothetical protein [Chloroflexia bacterium]
MRWAFVGIGRVTHRMVEAVRAAGHEVTLAAGRDAQKLRDWQDRFGVSQTTTDLHAA